MSSNTSRRESCCCKILRCPCRCMCKATSHSCGICCKKTYEDTVTRCCWFLVFACLTMIISLVYQSGRLEKVYPEDPLESSSFNVVSPPFLALSRVVEPVKATVSGILDYTGDAVRESELYSSYWELINNTTTQVTSTVNSVIQTGKENVIPIVDSLSTKFKVTYDVLSQFKNTNSSYLRKAFDP